MRALRFGVGGLDQMMVHGSGNAVFLIFFLFLNCKFHLRRVLLGRCREEVWVPYALHRDLNKGLLIASLCPSQGLLLCFPGKYPQCGPSRVFQGRPECGDNTTLHVGLEFVLPGSTALPPGASQPKPLPCPQERFLLLQAPFSPLFHFQCLHHFSLDVEKTQFVRARQREGMKQSFGRHTKASAF